MRQKSSKKQESDKKRKSRYKSRADRLAEGRCQGIGPAYVPFYMVEDFPSRGTCSRIWDTREGRFVHCMSQTEAMLYFLLRWEKSIMHIREQFLLDQQKINAICKHYGFPHMECCTTDFLVDYGDGSQAAFSVKYSERDFDPQNPKYRGRENKYEELMRRQTVERYFWESQGVSFQIVTRENLPETRVFNIRYIMGFELPLLAVSPTQKMMCLIAHGIMPAGDIDSAYVDPVKMLAETDCDVEELFEKHFGGNHG